MKIAVVHEWFIDWAGSERVTEQILASFPDADLFALVDFLPDEYRPKILAKRATTTFLQRAPFSRAKLHWYLPLMPLAIEQLNLSAYDLVISSSHAVAKGLISGPGQLHVSYVHSPMRYAWDMQHEYLRGSIGRGLSGLALRSTLHYLRLWDSRTANGVDAFAANSSFVAQRIHKIYRRTAEVIHPPVEIARFTACESREDFYVCVSRLFPYKRIDIIVDAFRQMSDRRLVVIGDGPQYRSLKRAATANITFLGYQSDEVIADHLQRAAALIFAAKEDFGIVPVEAQACGAPVIALGAGGVLETVLPLGTSPKPTGVFFHEQTAAAIVEAVLEFENNAGAFEPKHCRANAERFSPERFRFAFRSFVDRARCGLT